MTTVAANPVNIPLLNQVLARIEENRLLFDATRHRIVKPGGDIAYDVAGWTAVLSGAQFATTPAGGLSAYFVIPPLADKPECVCCYARRMLGIEHTIPQGHVTPPLFYAGNSLADIRRIADDLTARGGAA